MMQTIYHKNGDLVIWGNAPYGHIAIADGDSDNDGFWSYDQNYNGKAMHRQAHDYSNVYGSLRPYDQDKVLGFMLENIVDLMFYKDMYEDLRRAFGNNMEKYWEHLCEYGVAEHRTFSIVYQPFYYKEKYKDLKQAFGDDWWCYLNHFLEHGIFENRQASKVFDVVYYKQHNPDITNMSNVDATKHFIEHGIYEWRDTSPEFNVKIYKNASMNGDLRKAFGNNCKAYYEHFIKYGQYENRIAK